MNPRYQLKTDHFHATVFVKAYNWRKRGILQFQCALSSARSVSPFGAPNARLLVFESSVVKLQRIGIFADDADYVAFDAAGYFDLNLHRDRHPSTR